MEWAASLFTFENRMPPSDFIERIWRTTGVPERAMISVAVPNWHIVIVKSSRRPTSVFVRGPETRATIVEIPHAAEFVGIEFKLGTFIPALPVETLVDTAREIDLVSRAKMRLAGSHWEIPSFDNATDFVARLVRDGALVRDPVVEQALRREPAAVTERSVQRRFARATGVTCGVVRQIERAKCAAALLTAGTPILEAVDIAGYADQAHMTRSLQRFLGKTPGRLVSSTR